MEKKTVKNMYATVQALLRAMQYKSATQQLPPQRTNAWPTKKIIAGENKYAVLWLSILYFANQKNNFMKIEIGQPAPDFTLHAPDKSEVSLSAQKGNNVLLLFFPLAFTGVCTKELCNIRDNISIYNNANATVFGISVDSTFTLAKYTEEQHLNFKLLSDFNKEVSAAYGCLYDAFIGWMKGVSKRSAFVIDKEGVVQYAEILESAGDLPDFEAIGKVLASLN